eukprot:253992-Karenia_brevis.AAC.1
MACSFSSWDTSSMCLSGHQMPAVLSATLGWAGLEQLPSEKTLMWSGASSTIESGSRGTWLEPIKLLRKGLWKGPAGAKQVLRCNRDVNIPP